MYYYITKINGNDRTILSKHDNLDDALKEGESKYKELKCTIDCISGEIDNKGNINGKYRIYKVW